MDLTQLASQLLSDKLGLNVDEATITSALSSLLGDGSGGFVNRNDYTTSAPGKSSHPRSLAPEPRRGPGSPGAGPGASRSAPGAQRGRSAGHGPTPRLRRPRPGPSRSDPRTRNRGTRIPRDHQTLPTHNHPRSGAGRTGRVEAARREASLS